MSEIVKVEKYNTVTLYGLPEEIQNGKIREVSIFLETILSINGDESKKRLAVLLPQIKNSAKGMSVIEIKSAFKNYVEGKCSFEPRDNYLTLILFNKVINEYKSKYMRKTKQEQDVADLTQTQIDGYMQPLIEKAMVTYQKTGNIELASSKYDYLDSKGLIQGKLTLKAWEDHKKDTYNRSKKLLLESYKTMKPKSRENKTEIKQAIEQLQGKNINAEAVIMSKETLLKEYFDQITLEELWK